MANDSHFGRSNITGLYAGIPSGNGVPALLREFELFSQSGVEKLQFMHRQGATMSRHCTSTLLLIILLNLTACKVWHKRGADEVELHMDQQQCKDESQTSRGQGFVECMERLGWRYSDMSAPASDSEKDSTVAVGSEKAPGKPRESSRTENVKGWYQLDTNSGQLDTARSECKKTGTDSATFINCMEDQGWHPIYLRISVEEPDDMD